jgi:NADH dehydrogenase FAD-containing subunit
MLVQAKQHAFAPLDKMAEQIVNILIVQPINVIDRSIQALLDGPVLERRPVEEQESAHFVIVGFGEVGQELAVKLAQMAHYENLKRSRMTIVYSKRDEQAVEQFRELYPKFFPDLNALAKDLVEIDCQPN